MKGPIVHDVDKIIFPQRGAKRHHNRGGRNWYSWTYRNRQGWARQKWPM